MKEERQSMHRYLHTSYSSKAQSKAPKRGTTFRIIEVAQKHAYPMSNEFRRVLFLRHCRVLMSHGYIQQ